MKNDIIAIGGIRDRRYHYPKGFIDKRTGKPKTGFMKTSQGARLFVERNLKEITKGKVQFENLTPREKQVYKALTSDRAVNTFKYDGKNYYDPTGIIRNTLNKTKIPQGTKDLSNFLSKKQFRNLFEIPFKSPQAQKNEKLNTTLFEFVKGDKQQKYRSNKGNLLDVSSLLKKFEKKGYAISVDGQSGRDAVLFLKKFEEQQLQKFLDKYKKGDKIKVEILHNVKINPETKEIRIDTDETDVFEYYPQGKPEENIPDKKVRQKIKKVKK